MRVLTTTPAAKESSRGKLSSLVEKWFHKRLPIILLGLSSLLLPTVLLAENGPQNSERERVPETTTHTPISQATDYDEVIITSSPHSRSRFDVIQGTSVLSKEELEGALMPTLGETLAELPGISSTYFGPGASRPVIRGLDGPRVRILQNGLGTMDASVTSPDHAVATEGLLMERVEIIRGAGTLLFGGSAIGGVINVDDGRIPLEIPADHVSGDVRVLYGSAANEKAGSAGITGGIGDFAIRAAGAFKQSDDLEIPGYAVSQQLYDSDPGIDRGPYGRALSTETDSRTGVAGASWLGEQSMLGVSYGVVDDHYGVPSEPGESVVIDLLQKRFDSRGELGVPFLIFEDASFQYGYSDYEHKEIEGGDEIATVFYNKAHEFRVDLQQKEWGNLHGTIGTQFLHRDFRADGEEAYVAPSVTDQWGLFAVEEMHLDNWRLEGGLRYEWQKVSSEAANFERTFNTASFSLGAGYTFLEDYLVGVSLSRTERAPSAEELLANGAHLATGGFDVGDPNLTKESGLTIEGTIRKKRGRWSGGINMYWTRFSDFIYQENGPPCAPSEGGTPSCDTNPQPGQETLQLRTFQQNDVDFWGGEINAAWDFYRSTHYTGMLDLAFDWVNANLRNGPSSTLPRIPPYRVKAGLEGRSEYADLRFELWWVRAQKRVAAYEFPTDSYLMLNLILTIHPFPDARNVTLVAQGRNLLNEEARVASSFLKDKLPLPGREARVSIAVAF